jgi:hypothetical protein
MFVLPVDKPFDQTLFASEFVGSFDSNVGGGKPVVVDEAKLFNAEKFDAGKPNGGNAPNGGIDGKPIGRPQGRSKK